MTIIKLAALLLIYRFILMYAYFWYVVTAAAFWDLLHRSPELARPPYSPLVGVSLILAVYVGVFGCVWTFAAAFCVVWMIKSRRGMVFVFLMELTQLSVIFAVFVLQSMYLPRPLGGCAGLNGPRHPGDMFGLLDGMAKIDDSALKSTPLSECGNMVSMWRFEVALLVMQTAVVYGCLTAVCGRDLRMRPLEPLAVPVTGGPSWFGCLAPPVRFSRRYLQKWHRRCLNSVPLETREGIVSSYELVSLKPVGQATAATCSLAVILSQYPTFASTAQNLHYTDLKNLLLVSRAVRNATLSIGRTYDIFRKSSCVSGTEKRCWGCYSQVCESCDNEASLLGHEEHQHLRWCKPCCTRCYYTTCCRLTQTRPFRTPQICPDDHDGADEFRISRCPDCAPLSLGDLHARRRRTDSRRGPSASDSHAHCADCGSLVNGRGPRWWVCRRCLGECCREYHAGWQR